mmetsp:Transcript_27495/g.59812  ORF Transcript_27495/g.59812 Transcript_27495/m.59812 type:complete len:235 (+) Transcript_27495:234-938(+)
MLEGLHSMAAPLRNRCGFLDDVPLALEECLPQRAANLWTGWWPRPQLLLWAIRSSIRTRAAAGWPAGPSLRHSSPLRGLRGRAGGRIGMWRQGTARLHAASQKHQFLQMVVDDFWLQRMTLYQQVSQCHGINGLLLQVAVLHETQIHGLETTPCASEVPILWHHVLGPVQIPEDVFDIAVLFDQLLGGHDANLGNGWEVVTAGQNTEVHKLQLREVKLRQDLRKPDLLHQGKLR